MRLTPLAEVAFPKILVNAEQQGCSGEVLGLPFECLQLIRPIFILWPQWNLPVGATHFLIRDGKETSTNLGNGILSSAD